jgi:hypothetical protein
MDSLDDVPVMPLVLDDPAPSKTPHDASNRCTDKDINTLVEVASDLVSREDFPQHQLDTLQRYLYASTFCAIC